VEALATGVYERPLPLWRPRLIATGRWATDTEFDFQRPAHLRVDAELRVEAVEPTQHATTAALDTKVRTLNGLEHSLEQVELVAPGSLEDPFGSREDE
jgi:hypothetical protein